MTTPKPAPAVAETEHRVENDSGFLLNRATGKLTPWEGVRIRWRFVGERRWRKRVIVADPDLGQTPRSLRDDAEAIVAVLAKEARLTEKGEAVVASPVR